MSAEQAYYLAVYFALLITGMTVILGMTIGVLMQLLGERDRRIAERLRVYVRG